jgi:hypothetical protein
MPTEVLAFSMIKFTLTDPYNFGLQSEPARLVHVLNFGYYSCWKPFLRKFYYEYVDRMQV